MAVAHDKKPASIGAIASAAAAARAACLAGNGIAPAGSVLVGDGPVIGPKQ